MRDKNAEACIKELAREVGLFTYSQDDRPVLGPHFPLCPTLEERVRAIEDHLGINVQLIYRRAVAVKEKSK